MKRFALWTFAVLAGLWGIGVLLGGNASAPPLTADHRQAVERALNEKAYLQPKTLDVNDAGYVVADFEVQDADLIPPRTIAEDRLLAIRTALLPSGYKNYRVNINGPSPGPGLTRRYGSARFMDGGSLEWSTP